MRKFLYQNVGIMLVFALSTGVQGCGSADKSKAEQENVSQKKEATYTLSEQSHAEFSLPQPQKTGGMPLMEALLNRKTTRVFVDKMLSDQQISDLLWASNGVNREDGKRTAPSASNCQEIDIYLFTKNAIYFYDAPTNTLKRIKEGDFVRQAGNNDFFANAPIALAFVGNYDKMARYADRPEAQEFYSATDVGFVSQNLYLYCASEGLATVVCGNIERDVIQSLLGVANGKVLLTQPVGYTEDN